MMNVLVTGGSSGLGAAVIGAMTSGQYGPGRWEEENKPFSIINWDRKEPGPGAKVEWWDVNLTHEGAIRHAADLMMRKEGVPYALINCIGLNRIDWLEETDVENWNEVMAANAKSLFLLAKTFLPKMEQIGGGVIINVTSNAAWTPMTGSIAYNASKAAAHMVTRQVAHEVSRRGMKSTVLGIAPGKIAGTSMSEYIEGRVVELRGWTPEFAREYQLKGLPTGQELPVEVLADLICLLLTEPGRHRFFHGCIIPIGTWMGF